MWVKDWKINKLLKINKQIHKHRKSKQHIYERDTSFGRCSVDGGLSRTEKVTYGGWRVLCQWGSKPIYAPGLAQELEAVLPMEDNLLREIGEDGTSMKHNRMI